MSYVEWDSFEKVSTVFRALQSDEMFLHGGDNSRTVDIQPGPFIYDIARLATEFHEPAKDVIINLGTLFQTVSTDFGGTILIKGPKTYSIKIRGLEGPVTEESPLDELQLACMRRSAICLEVSPAQIRLWTHTSFLRAPDSSNRTYEQYLNGKITGLPQDVQTQIGRGLLHIVVDHVRQSGELQI